MVIIISRRIFKLAEFSSHSNDKTILLNEFPNITYIGGTVANVQVRLLSTFYAFHLCFSIL